MENRIRNALMNYEVYRAEINVCREWAKDCDSKPVRRRLRLLEQRVVIIEYWMSLLNEDEAFVVSKHLIDGIEWGRIANLYEQKWGLQFAKAERTLVCYQANALKKIARYANKNLEGIDCLFDEEAH